MEEDTRGKTYKQDTIICVCNGTFCVVHHSFLLSSGALGLTSGIKVYACIPFMFLLSHIVAGLGLVDRSSVSTIEDG